jgi:hypothetical protein
MLHGGWPFTREIGALLTKPNAYLDFSAACVVSQSNHHGRHDARMDASRAGER